MGQQINLRLNQKLETAAKKYIKVHKFKNLQELATEAIREKVVEKKYDESFTKKEITLIDNIIETSILKKRLGTENELKKALE